MVNRLSEQCNSSGLDINCVTEQANLNWLISVMSLYTTFVKKGPWKIACLFKKKIRESKMLNAPWKKGKTMFITPLKRPLGY